MSLWESILPKSSEYRNIIVSENVIKKAKISLYLKLYLTASGIIMKNMPKLTKRFIRNGWMERR